MILIELLPTALYAALAIWFMRPAGNGRPTGGGGVRSAGLAAALVIHAFVLSHQIFPDGHMRFGAGDALAVMTWLALVFYWVESLSSRLDGLHMLALPAAALCAAAPLLLPARHEIGNAASPLFRAHFVMAMTAYSLFTLAALHAMLMSAVERNLHRGRLSRVLENLPPLLVMEGLLFRLITIAFVLLSATLVTGIAFSEQVFGKPLAFSHKTVFAIAAWVVFGTLLAGRHFRGWRGRMALRWTLGGFFVLLLAYIGTQFVLEVVLGRS
ncbi:cytochrome C assembly family protein [Methyloversatilis thermotolerans]|uniref:cytochrome C assembly family protein n=1 Tax=Methyloversatilis thermotolerans TaxID=1346290 RepID=UPI00037CA7F4|nr:cytochrome c biogenesis protein CcsA [Methyloversatilis thermotolerans]